MDNYISKKYKFYKYCDCRNRLTTHIKLVKERKTLDFIANVIVAFSTKFKADLREPEYECLTCGKQS